MPKKRTKPKTRTIHCISVQQPFADQVVHGSKWCENRNWKTKFRGLIHIHASRCCPGEPKESAGPGLTGHIIGTAVLTDCVGYFDVVNPLFRHMYGDRKRRKFPEELEPYRQLAEAEGWTRESFSHACGDMCFILTDRTPLTEPIPAKGKLGIWQTEIPS